MSGCACTTLNPTILDNLETEINNLTDLANKNDYVIINWEFASTHTNELQRKNAKALYGSLWT